MRIAELTATGVHGYLSIHVVFHPELTFLTGLNGSGKTSALRLLMGLLTPSLEELGKLTFDTAEATIKDDSGDRVIRARQTESGIELAMEGVLGILRVSAAQLQILIDRRQDEARPTLYARIENNEAYKAIASISTPMFLGLDRRFYYGAPSEMAEFEARRRASWVRQGSDPMRIVPAILADVNLLFRDRLSDVLREQEQLDRRLRNLILLGAFRYTPHAFESSIRSAPPKWVLTDYQTKAATVAKAAGNLAIPVQEVQTTLEEFFKKMNQVAADLTAFQEHRDKERAGGRDATSEERNYNQVLLEWIINKPQADRIFEHFQQLEAYAAQRTRLHEPIERFFQLVNGFLAQTGKKIEMTESELEVVLEKNGAKRPLSALSSGERQIVVMLAHLALNKSLTGSGVFIVDEPELSLHIGWQERFVSAIREANPNVQLIMATHSPAIILEREENCRSLDA